MKKFSLVLILFLLFTFSAEQVAAAQVTGVVLDRNNIPMIEARVQIKNPVSKKVIAETISDFTGSYTLIVPDGTYDIAVIAKTPKGEETKIFSNQKITSAKQQDLKLNVQTNTPLSSKNDSALSLIIGGLFLLVLIGGLILWKKMKKKNSLTEE